MTSNSFCCCTILWRRRSRLRMRRICYFLSHGMNRECTRMGCLRILNKTKHHAIQKRKQKFPNDPRILFLLHNDTRVSKGTMTSNLLWNMAKTLSSDYEMYMLGTSQRVRENNTKNKEERRPCTTMTFISFMIYNATRIFVMQDHVNTYPSMI